MLHTIYARNNQGAAIFTYLIFFSLLYGAPSQIRTESQQILNLSALPISVTGHIKHMHYYGAIHLKYHRLNI